MSFNKENRKIKYKYIVTGNKVIAISSFAKKPVRGIARCMDSDTFNEENGKKLATLRCNEKVAAKRYKRASSYYEQANMMYNIWKSELERAEKYRNDSKITLDEAHRKTIEFVETL